MGVWWPNVWADCTKFVQRCVDCAAYHGVPERTAHRLNESALKFRDKYVMDFQGPFKKTKRGNLHFFTCVDSATMWFWGRPTAAKDAGTVIKILREIFLEFGAPRIIRADNGFGFSEGSRIKKFLRAEFPNTRLVLGTAYNPKSQQAIER
ncbi:unnamed protein product, partial [Amoebophrya sp. A25]|eukprot:GSA25T00028082001.1